MLNNNVLFVSCLWNLSWSNCFLISDTRSLQCGVTVDYECNSQIHTVRNTLHSTMWLFRTRHLARWVQLSFKYIDVWSIQLKGLEPPEIRASFSLLHLAKRLSPLAAERHSQAISDIPFWSEKSPQYPKLLWTLPYINPARPFSVIIEPGLTLTFFHLYEFQKHFKNPFRTNSPE